MKIEQLWGRMLESVIEENFEETLFMNKLESKF